jgi:hypothetical protein
LHNINLGDKNSESKNSQLSGWQNPYVADRRFGVVDWLIDVLIIVRKITDTSPKRNTFGIKSFCEKIQDILSAALLFLYSFFPLPGSHLQKL